MADPLPSYDELPVVPGAPAGSSWGLWGEGDVHGCLNLLTPERVQAGAACVRRGAVFPLNLELELPGPPLFNRSAFEHTVHDRPSGHDDELSNWNTQSSSQWDGFRHIRHPVHGFYNGVADEDHGIHHWARAGIAGRGVLVDVARWREGVERPLRPDRSDPITPADIALTIESQGVEVETGDILLIRTGWMSWYRSLSAHDRAELAGEGALSHCGLQPGFDTARTLWNLHIAAVAADNPALELWPPGALLEPDEVQSLRSDSERTPEFFVHFSLLPLLGLPIGELFDLDALADDCAADGIYTCFVTSAPLNLQAGVASPPNALAIK